MKPVKTIIIVCFLCICFLFTVGMTKTLRVNGKIINVGDTKAKIIMIVGEPLNRQVVGFIESKTATQETTIFIEVWTIAVDWYGSKEYYDLIFFGDRLNDIVWLRGLSGT